MKNKNLAIILIVMNLLIISCGCTEPNNSEIQDNPSKNATKNPDIINLKDRFVGKWNGYELKNNITLSLEFFSNDTGIFQSSPITWKIQNDSLELGMFSGDMPSYYAYNFSANSTQLKLNNLYSNEIFILYKN